MSAKKVKKTTTTKPTKQHNSPPPPPDDPAVFEQAVAFDPTEVDRPDFIARGLLNQGIPPVQIVGMCRISPEALAAVMGRAGDWELLDELCRAVEKARNIYACPL